MLKKGAFYSPRDVDDSYDVNSWRWMYGTDRDVRVHIEQNALDYAKHMARRAAAAEARLNSILMRVVGTIAGEETRALHHIRDMCMDSLYPERKRARERRQRSA